MVAQNNKQRFGFSADCSKIRARQGHSLAVDLGLKARQAPHLLYHGTAQQYLPAIQQIGLQRQNRQHVHLSSCIQTALQLGSRHGKAVVLQVAAAKMQQDAYSFYLSENGVWLTHEVPPDYLQIVSGTSTPESLPGWAM